MVQSTRESRAALTVPAATLRVARRRTRSFRRRSTQPCAHADAGHHLRAGAGARRGAGHDDDPVRRPLVEQAAVRVRPRRPCRCPRSGSASPSAGPTGKNSVKPDTLIVCTWNLPPAGVLGAAWPRPGPTRRWQRRAGRARARFHVMDSKHSNLLSLPLSNLEMRGRTSLAPWPPWQRRQKPSEAPGRIVVVENRKRLWIPLCIRLAGQLAGGRSRVPCATGSASSSSMETPTRCCVGRGSSRCSPRSSICYGSLLERRGRVVTKVSCSTRSGPAST